VIKCLKCETVCSVGALAVCLQKIPIIVIASPGELKYAIFVLRIRYGILTLSINIERA